MLAQEESRKYNTQIIAKAVFSTPLFGLFGENDLKSPLVFTGGVAVHDFEVCTRKCARAFGADSPGARCMTHRLFNIARLLGVFELTIINTIKHFFIFRKDISNYYGNSKLRFSLFWGALKTRAVSARP
jgi:hypothetical protein